MSSLTFSRPHEGLTLRQAALTAGIAYLLMPVTIAEFSIFPKLVIPGNSELTVENIAAHGKLFFVGVLCQLVTLILDVIIAWAFYILLAPVNRALSLLTAWFRLVYTVMALAGLLNLVTVFRLVHTPEYLTAFGPASLRAQVDLLFNSFHYDWSISLVIFGIHLILLGYLIYRSSYIPRILGILLILDGIGWVFTPLKPYLYPKANLGFFFIASFVELLLPLWLIIRGWKIPEPEAE